MALRSPDDNSHATSAAGAISRNVQGSDDSADLVFAAISDSNVEAKLEGSKGTDDLSATFGDITGSHVEVKRECGDGDDALELAFAAISDDSDIDAKVEGGPGCDTALVPDFARVESIEA